MSYVRSEVLRTFRNRRAFIFSIVFPLILFWVIAAPQKDDDIGQGLHISVALYYMVTMAAYGSMIATMSAGARIASERESGWTRQLRISPLPVFAYFRTKVVVAYLTALTAMVLLYISGYVIGVRLDAGRWLEMTGLILLGLVPFAAAGIWLGHILTSDSMGPVIGGGAGLLALVGGFWFPIADGFVHDVGQFLPSWWLVQASHVSLGGDAWPAKGWAIIVAWTVVLTLGAARAYRRDSGRV
ncbi:MAG: type transport system permease protein [Solirubrobacteraceae bacterium]|nr:type transport system permease protein [Solirubrobacteraceae bacterium]